MKRFWKEVDVEATEGGWRVTLDGRAVRTQGREAQVVPTRELAEALAAEWRAQGDTVDPRSFPFRDLADYAIDHVATDRAPVIAELLRFAETDTLCFRAGPDEPLWQRQQEVWEPLVAAVEAREGVRLERVSGVVAKPLPDATRARLEERLAAIDPFALSALRVMTALAASLCVGLAALDPDADPRALFAAANAEEDWQAEQWGWDAEAETARSEKERAFVKAAEFLLLSSPRT